MKDAELLQNNTCMTNRFVHYIVLLTYKTGLLSARKTKTKDHQSPSFQTRQESFVHVTIVGD